MITSESEYESSKRALDLAERALKSMKMELSSASAEKSRVLLEPYLEYVIRLRAEIDEYLGISAIEEEAVPIWIRLKGPHISSAEVPVSILSGFLDDLRKGVQRVAEYLDVKVIRDSGRRSKEISDICDFRVRIVPGSVKIGVSFPSPHVQKTLDGDVSSSVVRNALSHMLDGASWSVGLERRKLETLFSNPEERYLILEQLDSLLQMREGEISSIEFYGSYVPRRILVTDKARKKIRSALQIELTAEPIAYEGVVREIDLDKKQFMLRESPDIAKEIRCHYDESLEGSAVSALKGRVRVKVYGDLKKDTKGRPHHIDVKRVVQK